MGKKAGGTVMIEWAYSFLNILLCLTLLALDFRRRRIMSLFWFMCSYFGVLVSLDLANCPLEYPVGYVSATVTFEEVGRVVQFMFAANLSLAAGECLAILLLERRTSFPIAVPPPQRFTLSPASRPVRIQTWISLALFVVGGALYVSQVHGFSYEDYVTNVESSWRALLFIAAMPVIPLLIMQRRYFLAAAPLAVNLILVALLKVRSFMLFSLIPGLAVIVFQVFDIPQRSFFAKWARYVGIGSIVLTLGGAASYVIFLRTGAWHLPEEALPRGMYLVFQQVDAGAEKTGMQGIELAAKSLLYPVYNRFLFDDYRLPEDPAEYIAELVTGRFGAREGFRHFPLLLYSELFLSLGARGLWLAVFWGFVLGCWEAMLRKNPLAWASFLPFFTWTIYIVCRGAPGHAFYVISRNLYIQLAMFVFSILGAHFLYPRVARVPVAQQIEEQVR